MSRPVAGLPAPLLGSVLGPGTVARETLAPLAGSLLGEEVTCVAGAAPVRRDEFRTGRLCARSALAELGVAPQPILPDERGAPGWPPGIVGSLTHTRGYIGAAVGRTDTLLALGIDAERDLPLPDGVARLVASPVEQAATHQVSRARGVCGDRLLFSAKECVFKVWYPITRSWLGFDDVHLELRDDNTFTSRLLEGRDEAPRVLHQLDGRWVAAEGLLVAAITVPRRA